MAINHGEFQKKVWAARDEYYVAEADYQQACLAGYDWKEAREVMRVAYDRYQLARRSYEAAKQADARKRREARIAEERREALNAECAWLGRHGL